MANADGPSRGDKTPPGSEILYVPDEDGGEPIPLARAIKSQHPDLSWGRIRKWCAAGRVQVDGVPVLDGRRSLEPGSKIVVLPEGHTATFDPIEKVTIRFQDKHVVVVEKPTGVSTVPFDEKETDTLISRVQRTWAVKGVPGSEMPLMVVQRLDKETSGVVVFARSDMAHKKLVSDMRHRAVERSYLAVVNGVVSQQQGTFRSFLAQPRHERKRRSVKGDAGDAKEAITHFEVVERYARATLVRLRLETGRTHQIRIHLSEAGHPLVGEKVYIKDPTVSLMQFKRVALHAAVLGFEHPVTRKKLSFVSRLPDDLAALVQGMGSKLNETQRALDVPDWAKPAKGQKRIRSLKELLDRAAESPDWGTKPNKPAVKVDSDGWMHVNKPARPARPAQPARPARPKKPAPRRIRVSKPGTGSDSDS